MYVYGIIEPLLLKSPGPCGWFDIDKIFISIVVPPGADQPEADVNFGPFKFLQDTADASYLSGIATFGGFWTFVNGTFALLFGTNVIYFMFGGWNHGFAPTFADRLERLPRSQTAFRFEGSATYSSVVHSFADGMRTSQPSTLKGACPVPKMLVSWPLFANDS
ncbi:hypothetical protein B0H14DRAFT_3864521 [Mycena olivaceomarginata]|nr:hypothetical protein B0H14DRAFT_3864521 [Mycena olivaceomarginata]